MHKCFFIGFLSRSLCVCVSFSLSLSLSRPFPFIYFYIYVYAQPKQHTHHTHNIPGTRKYSLCIYIRLEQIALFHHHTQNINHHHCQQELLCERSSMNFQLIAFSTVEERNSLGRVMFKRGLFSALFGIVW